MRPKAVTCHSVTISMRHRQNHEIWGHLTSLNEQESETDIEGDNVLGYTADLDKLDVRRLTCDGKPLVGVAKRALCDIGQGLLTP